MGGLELAYPILAPARTHVPATGHRYRAKNARNDLIGGDVHSAKKIPKIRD